MSFEVVRPKPVRVRAFPAFPFLVLALVTIAGLVVRPAPQTVSGGAVNAGDVAWMLLTGVFAKDVGLMSGATHTFFVHCVALPFVTVFAFTGSWVLYKVTDAIIPLRVTPEQEDIGLDIRQHGEVMDEAAARAAFAL